MRRVVILSVCGLLLLGCHIDTIPPESQTYGVMHMIKRRVLRYAKIHNQTPKAIDELPVIPEYDNNTADAWGRPVIYIVEQNRIVKLVSYGKDGREGGVKQDADMVGTFSLKDDQGRWQDELCDWIIDPLKS